MISVVALPIVCQPGRVRVLTAALLLGLGCSRTDLYAGEIADADPPTLVAGGGLGGGSLQGGAAGTAGKPATTGGSPAGGTSPLPRPCEPSAETCNGIDDDCNGAVDDIPPLACPNGGFRLCLTGRLSACPKRCEVCVPGSVRVCQNSFCSFWGEQECSADGLGFSNCREAHPPPECEAIAKKFEDSAELEQCCLDNGYCCVDQHDLDRDGDRREMLGACADTVCQ